MMFEALGLMPGPFRVPGAVGLLQRTVALDKILSSAGGTKPGLCKGSLRFLAPNPSYVTVGTRTEPVFGRDLLHSSRLVPSLACAPFTTPIWCHGRPAPALVPAPAPALVPAPAPALVPAPTSRFRARLPSRR